MGERKVLNKYIDPEFDPAKIPKRTKPINNQSKVRDMLPMSVRCKTCGNYMYKGTKYNARKEDTLENYLGIKILRFYGKCSNCCAEFSIKTDPKNSDNTVEFGVSRNFEPWRDQDEELEKGNRKREEEEMGDAMKCMENKALSSKREIDMMSALDEMKSIKSRHSRVSVDDMLTVFKHTREPWEEDLKLDAIIKSVFSKDKELVKRIDDDEWDDDDSVKRRKVSVNVRNFNGGVKNSGSKVVAKSPSMTLKVKKKEEEKQKVVKKDDKCVENRGGSSILRSLAHYDSEDDE